MLRSSLMLLLCAVPLVACGSDAAPGPTLAGAATAQLAPVGAVSAEEEARVREALGGLVRPDLEIDHIGPTPVADLLEVAIGGQVLYVSRDGKILIQGSMFDIEARMDLAELSKARRRGPLLAEVGPERRIIFGDEDAPHRLTVFTDIDCGYCRRMQAEMAEYNQLGIAIEYLFFPRGGENSEGWDKAVSVWCADDRHEAMTEAKAGRPIESRTCANPVADDFELGRRAGVEGTPATFTTEGVQIGGYLPPAQMLRRLEALKAAPGS